jgi:hypothetical protein
VLGLTQRLRREGLDAIIDQFFPFPAEGWIRWMEQQVDAADFILCVCTENYRIGFDGLRQGPSGKGVNWEGQTISVCIYEAGGENSRFIPVIFAEDGPSAIPRALKRYTYFVWTGNTMSCTSCSRANRPCRLKRSGPYGHGPNRWDR